MLKNTIFSLFCFLWQEFTWVQMPGWDQKLVDLRFLVSLGEKT